MFTGKRLFYRSSRLNLFHFNSFTKKRVFSPHKKSVSTIVFKFRFTFLVRNKNQVTFKPYQPLHYSYGKTIFIIYSHIYKLCLTSTSSYPLCRFKWSGWKKGDIDLEN